MARYKNITLCITIHLANLVLHTLTKKKCNFWKFTELFYSSNNFENSIFRFAYYYFLNREAIQYYLI